VDYKAGELVGLPVGRGKSSSPAGMLVVGTRNGIELWKHDPKAAIVVWNRIWERYVSLSVSTMRAEHCRMLPCPESVIISPASGHIACFSAVSCQGLYRVPHELISQAEKCVRVLTINAKGELSGMPQEMRHPRELEWIGWRKPRLET
jgi:hypothetical protein